MCRFYQKGACKRGAACDFAHEEVRAKPDLQRTKPCPALANGQPCEDPNCSFAHFTGELRRFKPSAQASDAHADAGGRRSGRASRAENPRSSCSTVGSSSGSSRDRASSDASADCAGVFDLDLDGCSGGLKLGLGAMDTDAGSAGTSSWATTSSVWSRQTTACGSDGGFSRQTSGVSDGDFSRQTSEGDRRPAARGRYKTRMCSFYAMGRCRKDECTFAHGAHELSERTGGGEISCGARRTGGPPAEQTRPRQAGGGARPTANLSSVPPPPRLWQQPPSWLSESTECGAPGSPGLPSTDDDSASWAPPSEPSTGLPSSSHSCADEGEEEDEEECRLVVVNTFLTILESSKPKEFRRSLSAPPGR